MTSIENFLDSNMQSSKKRTYDEFMSFVEEGDINNFLSPWFGGPDGNANLSPINAPLDPSLKKRKLNFQPGELIKISPK